MIKSAYTPILKTKRGESKAISNLDEHIKENIIPFFDVLSLKEGATNGNDVHEHIIKQALNISSAWKSRGFCYVDLFDISPAARGLNGIHPVTILHSRIASDNVQAIPVVGIERDISYKLAIRNLIAHGADAVAIRLDIEDIQLPSSLRERIDKLVYEIGATKIPIHVFMDFRSIEGLSADLIYNQAAKAINEIKKSYPARIVFSASAIVSNMGMFKRDSLNRVERSEYLIWKKLQNTNMQVDFADYGVVHPDYFDFDPKLIKPAAKIRYATDTSWIVIKGSCWRENTSQHHELSQMLTSQSDFRGVDSWGGEYITSSAIGRPKYGSLETWVTIDQNNHITHTVRQIAAITAKNPIEFY